MTFNMTFTSFGHISILTHINPPINYCKKEGKYLEFGTPLLLYCLLLLITPYNTHIFKDNYSLFDYFYYL